MLKKKIAVILAILTAAASLTACTGSSTTNTPAANTSVQSSQQSEAQTASNEESLMGEETSEQKTEDNAESSAQSIAADQQSSKQTSEKTSSQTSSKPAEQSSKQTSNKPAEQSSQQTSTKPVQQSSQQTSTKPVQQSSQQTSTKPVQQSSQQTSTKPVQQSSQQTSTKPVQQSSQQTSTKPVEQSSQQSSGSDTKITKADSAIGDEALYRKLFDINTKVNIEITMSKAEIDKLQNDYKIHERNENAKSEIYRKADVTITVGNEKYTIDEVGIRLKGNNTLSPFYAKNGSLNLSNYKLSFDETFDDKTEYGSDAKVWKNETERKLRKKRTFATLNGLDLKWNLSYDDTYIREIHATQLFEAGNVMVQKINLTQLGINGNNYGVYKVYEPIDNTFLEKRLPEAALDGDLYKCVWAPGSGGWSGCNYKSSNTIGVQDNSAGKRYNFNLKTNKKSSKNENLKKLLSVINKSNPTRAELESVVDTQNYANFMAASYFAGGPDDIRNNYNNHYVYFRKDNGKAVFIPYDNDRTMGITYGYNPDGKGCSERNPYSGWAAGANQGQENPLIKLTIIDKNNSTFNYVKDMYTAQLKKLAASDIMKNNTAFNKMYNTAKSHFEGAVTPSVKFDNQKQTFKFSLDGNKNSGDKSNMSFEQFRSAIISTFNSKVK